VEQTCAECLVSSASLEKPCLRLISAVIANLLLLANVLPTTLFTGGMRVVATAFCPAHVADSGGYRGSNGAVHLTEISTDSTPR
jgi:hypothetical protein